ncbi:MAG: isoprenylcysteine carboxylmethyltransferase family protein [Candidatus Aminicenantes bacterium]|nr:isoprenylcysteine carboxylmethyltransferase family protein [Candidatus Aminicenantes bacterium]
MNKDIIRRLVQVFSVLLLQGAILFVAAGTLSWKWAWIVLLLSLFLLIINLILLPAELIEERGRKKENVKKWDRMLTSIIIFPTILMYVISGLDQRFNWTGDVHIIINIAGLVLIFSGSMIFTWSMVSNKFFSTLVRLQTDRQHTVVTEGPYNYVRHPGYLGYIIFTLATPIALGTFWGLVFSGIIGVLLIIRTVLEDATLKKELPGYAEYTENVKYKLIPFLW